MTWSHEAAVVNAYWLLDLRIASAILWKVLGEITRLVYLPGNILYSVVVVV